MISTGGKKSHVKVKNGDLNRAKLKMMVHREKWYGMVGVGHGISQQTYRRLTQLICFYFSCAADDGKVEKRKED